MRLMAQMSIFTHRRMSLATTTLINRYPLILTAESSLITWTRKMEQNQTLKETKITGKTH